MKNEGYESQFTGSPLAEAMGMKYRCTRNIYREYVTADYGFVYVDNDTLPRNKLTEEEYTKAIREGANYAEMTRYMKGMRDEPKLMNKGAVRLTPKDEPFEDSLWIYNHDGSYRYCKPGS